MCSRGRFATPAQSLSRIVARAEGYNTCAATAWALSIVPGPFSIAPSRTRINRISLLCRRRRVGKTVCATCDDAALRDGARGCAERRGVRRRVRRGAHVAREQAPRCRRGGGWWWWWSSERRPRAGSRTARVRRTGSSARAGVRRQLMELHVPGTLPTQRERGRGASPRPGHTHLPGRVGTRGVPREIEHSPDVLSPDWCGLSGGCGRTQGSAGGAAAERGGFSQRPLGGGAAAGAGGAGVRGSHRCAARVGAAHDAAELQLDVVIL
jgi:hypothetical protein